MQLASGVSSIPSSYDSIDIYCRCNDKVIMQWSEDPEDLDVQEFDPSTLTEEELARYATYVLYDYDSDTLYFDTSAPAEIVAIPISTLLDYIDDAPAPTVIRCIDYSNIDMTNNTKLLRLKHLYGYAFTSLTTINFGENFDMSNVISTEGMFLNTRSIENTFGTLTNTTQLTTIDRMFYDTYNLETVHLEDLDADVITSATDVLTGVAINYEYELATNGAVLNKFIQNGTLSNLTSDVELTYANDVMYITLVYNIPEYPDVMVPDVQPYDALFGKDISLLATNRGIFIANYSRERSQRLLEPRSGEWNLALECVAHSLAQWGSTYFAGTDTGLYSSSNGTNWTKVNNDSISNITALMTDGKKLFVGTESGLYSYNGTNWTELVEDEHITALCYGSRAGSAHTYLAAVYGYTLLQSIDGVHWSQIQEDIADATTYSISNVNGLRFAHTNEGIYVGVDALGWSLWTDAITTVNANNPMLYANGMYYVGTGTGLKSSEDGITWTTELENKTVLSLEYVNGKIYAACGNDGLFVKNGSEWSAVEDVNGDVFTVEAFEVYEQTGDDKMRAAPSVVETEYEKITKYFVCTSTGLYSSPNGTEWTTEFSEGGIKKVAYVWDDKAKVGILLCLSSDGGSIKAMYQSQWTSIKAPALATDMAAFNNVYWLATKEGLYKYVKGDFDLAYVKGEVYSIYTEGNDVLLTLATSYMTVQMTRG